MFEMRRDKMLSLLKELLRVGDERTWRYVLGFDAVSYRNFRRKFSQMCFIFNT